MPLGITTDWDGVVEVQETHGQFGWVCNFQATGKFHLFRSKISKSQVVPGLWMYSIKTMLVLGKISKVSKIYNPANVMKFH